jgi:Helix-turn-helix domain
MTRQQHLAEKALAAKLGRDPRQPMLPQTDDDILLTRPEAAAYLRISVPTLELWWRRGVGPPGVRIGRSVRHRLGDLRRYVGRSVE